MTGNDNSVDLHYLGARAAIQDVLARYFHGLDTCDPREVRSCFTDDVHVYYDERPPVSGLEAVMAHFRTFGRMEKGLMKGTTHFMGNLNFKFIRAGIAETEMNAIAFLVDPSDSIAMRSLRYLDRFRCDEAGWRISDRVHTLDWSCQLPANHAVSLAQRVSALPDRP